MDIHESEIIHQLMTMKWTAEDIKFFVDKTKASNDFIKKEKLTIITYIVGVKTKFNGWDRSIISLLLENGADPLQQIDTSYSAIGKLASLKEKDLVMLFLKYVNDINVRIDDHRSFRHIFFGGSLTPLHLAVLSGLTEVFEYVLSRNPDLEAYSCRGHTPLHAACSLKNDFGMSKILLQKGADLNLRDIKARTPLFTAIRYNRLKQFKLLLDHNASVLIPDFMGNSPLHYACKRNANKEMCRLLLQKGCKPNGVNSLGYRPLQYLVRNENPQNEGNEEDIAKMLIEHGARLDITTLSKGDSIIQTAITDSERNANMSLIIFLLKNGVDINYMNFKNESFFDTLHERINHNRHYLLHLFKFLTLEERVNKLKYDSEIETSIRSYKEFFSQRSLCMAEIDLLTETVVDEFPEISILKLYTLDRKKLIYLCDNYKIRSFMENFDPNCFPIYGEDIKVQFQKSLREYYEHVSFTNILECTFDCDYTTTVIIEKMSYRYVTRFLENSRWLQQYQINDSLVYK